MASDLDIQITANMLIRKHGVDARFHAAQMVDEMLDTGNARAHATWSRVLKAMEYILDRNAGTLH